MTIIASPQRVCSDHGLEFWTGLLAYTRGRSGPCVKHEAVCDCMLCEEQGASRLRALAINECRPIARRSRRLHDAAGVLATGSRRLDPLDRPPDYSCRTTVSRELLTLRPLL